MLFHITTESVSRDAVCRETNYQSWHRKILSPRIITAIKARLRCDGDAINQIWRRPGAKWSTLGLVSKETAEQNTPLIFFPRLDSPPENLALLFNSEYLSERNYVVSHRSARTIIRVETLISNSSPLPQGWTALNAIINVSEEKFRFLHCPSGISFFSAEVIVKSTRRTDSLLSSVTQGSPEFKPLKQD